MKLKNGFVTHESAGKQILLSASGGFNGLVKSNKTAAFIIDCLKSETNENEIINALLEKYDVARDVVEKDVKSWSQCRKGRITGKGQIGGVRSILLPQELRTLTQMFRITQERPKGKHHHAKRNINRNHPPHIRRGEDRRMRFKRTRRRGGNNRHQAHPDIER